MAIGRFNGLVSKYPAPGSPVLCDVGRMDRDDSL